MSRIRGLGNREPHRRILNDCSGGRAYVLRRLQSTHRREMHRPATPDPEYHGIDRRRLHALGNSALISWSSTTKRDTQRSFCSKEESRPMPTGTRKRLGDPTGPVFGIFSYQFDPAAVLPVVGSGIVSGLAVGAEPDGAFHGDRGISLVVRPGLAWRRHVFGSRRATGTLRLSESLWMQ